MGTIVSAKTNQGIVIGADCLNTFEDLVVSSLQQAESCISKFGESYLGLNSTYALQQISQNIFASLSGDSTSDTALADKDQIRSLFNAHLAHLRAQYHLLPHQSHNIPFETLPLNALVVNRHGIFKVDASRCVYEYKKFWAIGTGEAFALGALQALYDEDADAESLVRAALKACGTFETNKNREITLKTIRLPNLKLARSEKGSDKSKDGQETGKLLLHRGPVSIRRGKKAKKKDSDSPAE